jgi:hypothetical protein
MRMEEYPMTAFKSTDTSRRNCKHNDAQACLLRDEGETIRRNPRAMREAHGGGCVLTQSRPGAFCAGDMSLHTASASASRKTGMSPTSSVYETGARITCIDRAIIRAYFHSNDEGAPARRKKSEGYAKRAAGQRDRDARFLPEDLERRLTPLPGGYSRMLRGSSVILVEDETHKIIDAVRGVAVRDV